MNQLMRMSEFRLDELQPPSPDLRIRFVEAGTFRCKFIIGEPDEHAVCCGARTDGRSWCDYHRLVVFEPARPGRIR